MVQKHLIETSKDCKVYFKNFFLSTAAEGGGGGKGKEKKKKGSSFQTVSALHRVKYRVVSRLIHNENIYLI